MKWIILKIALASILLFVCFFWCLAGIEASERNNQRISAEYHQSPYCTSTSYPASTLEPCTYEPVQVADIYFIHTSGRHSGHTDYFVVLNFAKPPRHRVRIYSDLYHVVAQGDALTAQEWRGKTRFLSYKNRWYKTTSDPDDQNRGNLVSRFMLYFAGFFFAFFIAVYGMQQQKLLRQGPAATASEYPLVRDED